MEKYDCNNIVFSSSATVYGDPERVPIVETDNKGDKILTTNPYGTTKLFIERIGNMNRYYMVGKTELHIILLMTGQKVRLLTIGKILISAK